MTNATLRHFLLPLLALAWLACTLAAHAAQNVPGTFEAEDFDVGGAVPGNYDLTGGNQGDAGYRTGEDADIFVSNAAGGGRVVKNFQGGEWLAYTINVPATANYYVEARASTNIAYPGSSYYVQVDGVNVTGAITLPDTGGWDQYQWLGKRTLSLTAGTHLLRIVAVTPYFNLDSVRVTAAVSTPYFGAPSAVPGVFEGEAFDRGGEGAAYHDGTAGNQGDSGVRNDEDVDIFVTTDAQSGSPYIVYMSGAERLAYTINVQASGNYYIELRASTNRVSAGNPGYRVQVDGNDAISFAQLEVASDYRWMGRSTLALNAGVHVITIVNAGGYDILLNSIRLTLAGSSGQTQRSIPGVIEAEDFDAGGEGRGYHENTPGNQGDAYFRTGEDVDIFAARDSGSGSWYAVKNFEAGEWLAYSINVPTSGYYDVDLRAATHPAFPNASFYVQVDGSNVSGIITLPETGGWDSYQWTGKSTIPLTAGTHLLRIVAYQPYFNFNSLRVVSSP